MVRPDDRRHEHRREGDEPARRDREGEAPPRPAGPEPGGDPADDEGCDQSDRDRAMAALEVVLREEDHAIDEDREGGE